MPIFKDNSTADVIEHQSPIKGMPSITITRVCRYCHQTHRFTMPVDDYRQWADSRKAIQKALPYFNAGEREIILSQTCPDCWTELFGKDE